MFMKTCNEGYEKNVLLRKNTCLWGDIMRRKITVRLDYDVEKIIDELVNSYGYKITELVNDAIRMFYRNIMTEDEEVER